MGRLHREKSEVVPRGEVRNARGGLVRRARHRRERRLGAALPWNERGRLIERIWYEPDKDRLITYDYTYYKDGKLLGYSWRSGPRRSDDDSFTEYLSQFYDRSGKLIAVGYEKKVGDASVSAYTWDGQPVLFDDFRMKSHVLSPARGSAGARSTSPSAVRGSFHDRPSAARSATPTSCSSWSSKPIPMVTTPPSASDSAVSAACCPKESSTSTAGSI